MQSLPRFDGMGKGENFGDLIKEEKVTARDDSNMHRTDTSIPQPAQRGRPSTKRPQLPGICKTWKCVRKDCPKSFSRKSDLNRHDNIHTNTRIHKCDHKGCGKTFIQTSALTVHRRIHTGEKPHVCPVCNRPFSDSSSLARHKRTHEKKILPCPVVACNKRFADEAGVQKHVSREHPREMQARVDEHGCGSRDPAMPIPKASLKSVVAKDADAVHQRNCIKPEEHGKMEIDGNTAPFDLQLASHASLPTANEAYYPSRSPVSALRASTAGTWHLGSTQQQYPSRTCTPRAQRPHLPLVIPAVDGIYDVSPMSAPMSAPISYGRSDMASHPFPYMTSVMAQDYAQAYSNNPSAASSPMAQHMQMPAYHMVLSYRQRPSPMYRQQSHRTVESFCPSRTPLHSTSNIDADMYSSPVESHYREPQDMGIINDAHHYQLPGTAFDMPDDDKMIDEFGEPLPSQLF